MNSLKSAKSALISVFSKEGLAPLVEKLNELGISIYSTGGTEKFIKDLGIDVIPVEDVTSYPSILGGRVKTLHPKVFGGILNRQSNEQDKKELEQYGIPQIDIVIVDLYPFEKTVASGASEQDIIEKIDIGGISLISSKPSSFSLSSRASFSSSFSSSFISASPRATETGWSPKFFISDSTTIMQRLQTIFLIYSFNLAFSV